MFYTLQHLMLEMRSMQRQISYLGFLFATFAIFVCGIVTCTHMKEDPSVPSKIPTYKAKISYHFTGELKGKDTDLNSVVLKDFEVPIFFQEDGIKKDNEEEDTTTTTSTPAPDTLSMGTTFVDCISNYDDLATDQKNMTLKEVDEFSNFVYDYSQCIKLFKTENFPTISNNRRRRYRRAPPSNTEYFAKLSSCMTATAHMRDIGLPIDLKTSESLIQPAIDDEVSERLVEHKCLTANLQVYYQETISGSYLEHLANSFLTLSECAQRFKNAVLQNYSFVDAAEIDFISVDTDDFIDKVWTCECDYWYRLINDYLISSNFFMRFALQDEAFDDTTEVSPSNDDDDEGVVNPLMEDAGSEEEGKNVGDSCRLSKEDAQYLLFVFAAVTVLLAFFFVGIISERVNSFRMMEQRKRDADEMRVHVLAAWRAHNAYHNNARGYKKTVVKYENV